jgi:hypothetical protein
MTSGDLKKRKQWTSFSAQYWAMVGETAHLAFLVFPEKSMVPQNQTRPLPFCVHSFDCTLVILTVDIMKSETFRRSS